ncbi:hypothetical protein GH714_019130 [Hevea brasiliensis]|uniref:MULE transposase domain-containing protein n=1 Tax=Hevea brasiliensis TaxID=3981 RepID=A0A6A6NAE5_HEVBR|nr:hypothetical protein GH714_019130 [Hevea brasiliensis]
MSRLMVAHRSLNMDMKRRLEANDIAGIRPAKSIRLSNVLWVHPRSRAAYEEFNDVVSFDTTYLVNRYKLPFATIVGVNHHGQSILLGCALISHEDVNTFKWLFMTWLEAMEDVHPNSILTDQCESMRKAIREVTIDTNNVDENEENERFILNPHVTRSRGRPRINRHRSVREITQANSGRNRNSGRGRRRGRPRNNINSNIAE